MSGDDETERFIQGVANLLAEDEAAELLSVTVCGDAITVTKIGTELARANNPWPWHAAPKTGKIKPSSMLFRCWAEASEDIVARMERSEIRE